ncbi:NAC domain-containing protein 104-like [Chenopodium quinoa]|uniref:NAC domain-containing protein 104-like n=1 Tax=Chenopodium quinoa TaxID=63459 RepID=UPI000B77832D|nr:NAC domain-containing protein 104-like [Chenopodium quinoa]
MVQNLPNMIENNENMLDMKQLPPGFRFDPTDEELVLHFMYSKLKLSSSSRNYPSNNCNNPHLIPELEDFFHHYHPRQLHGEAFESCGQWYFYTRKTENRVSENGYWEELVGMDQPIYAGNNCNKLVGLKKWLVFYDKGMYASSGVKNGWFMQEYHACSNNNLFKRRKSKQPAADVMNKWVLCRVQQVCDESQWMNTLNEDKYNNEVELSSSDEAVFLAMEENDQDEVTYPY